MKLEGDATETSRGPLVDEEEEAKRAALSTGNGSVPPRREDRMISLKFSS